MSVNAWASFFYSLSISPLVCLWSWEFFSIIHLWDVFDVNTDVDNCRTVRWQLKLYVILRHADALCLEMNIFLRLDQIDNTNLSVWIWVKIFFGWRKQGKVTIHGLGSLGSGLWALGSWALGSLGSGLWARRPGLQRLLGSLGSQTGICSQSLKP